MSGISDGSKKVGEERELGVRVGEGGEDAKAFTLNSLLYIILQHAGEEVKAKKQTTGCARMRARSYIA